MSNAAHIEIENINANSVPIATPPLKIASRPDKHCVYMNETMDVADPL